MAGNSITRHGINPIISVNKNKVTSALSVPPEVNDNSLKPRTN